MVAKALDAATSKGTRSAPLAELARPMDRSDRVRRIGRVRLPVALHYRPWATLYVLPDGRRWWIVRLWEVDRPVPRRVSTATLLAYARRNGLHETASAICAIAERAAGLRGGDGAA